MGGLHHGHGESEFPDAQGILFLEIGPVMPLATSGIPSPGSIIISLHLCVSLFDLIPRWARQPAAPHSKYGITCEQRKGGTIFHGL